MKKSTRSNPSTTLAPAAEPQPAAVALRPPLPRISMKERRKNQALPTDKVLTLLQTEAPRFWELAEVVGKWVWIQFGEKQPREITAALSQLGFHWNNARQLWQHPCGTLKPFDPRFEFGSYFAADRKAA